MEYSELFYPVWGIYLSCSPASSHSQLTPLYSVPLGSFKTISSHLDDLFSLTVLLYRSKTYESVSEKLTRYKNSHTQFCAYSSESTNCRPHLFRLWLRTPPSQRWEALSSAHHRVKTKGPCSDTCLFHCCIDSDSLTRKLVREKRLNCEITLSRSLLPRQNTGKEEYWMWEVRKLIG